MNIEINHLSKEFDNFKLEDISFKVPKGKIVGLIGENGAGKTTLIKCILNIMKSSGDIRIFQKQYSDILKKDIGVIFDNSFLNEKYNANDINIILKNIYENWDEKLYYKYLDEFKIPQKIEIKKLSTGMKKKVQIASCLAHHPKLLILDEPTSGLDPIIRSQILDIFQDFVKNKENSILISTHITTDLEHIADQVLFISNGKILLNEHLKTLLDTYQILTIDKEKFNTINKDIIIRYKESNNDYQLLINKKDSNKYQEYIRSITTLEDIMILYIRGLKC